MKIHEMRRICCDINYELKDMFIPGARINSLLLDQTIKYIIFRDFEKTPLQNLGDFASMKGAQRTSSNAERDYYLWPCEGEEGGPYHKAVGVCKKGVNSLNSVLLKMMEFSYKMVGFSKPDNRKIVMVMTDYWDLKQFRNYEKEMLNYALNDGIWYIFLLVTDYGCTQIPFLPDTKTAFLGISREPIEDE